MNAPLTAITSLETLVRNLRQHPNVAEKLNIAAAYEPGVPVSGNVLLGDDTAALSESGSHLLFAAEGMMESFVALDPWFAGYCAVMVNLSDIAAMGGRAIAIVDVLWAHEQAPELKEIWAGLRAASSVYGVPIVGGHTARFPANRTPLLAAAVVGRAHSLISSFTARPGEILLTAIDLRATYRGEGTLFWNASVDAPAERLRGDLDLLPTLAEAGLVTAGKDISNGGLIGTLAMLLATSRCGATLDLDALPKPPEVALERWLLSFPSYGFLVTAKPENVAEVIERFHVRGLACAAIGEIETGDSFALRQGGEAIEFAKITPAPSQTGPLPLPPKNL